MAENWQMKPKSHSVTFYLSAALTLVPFPLMVILLIIYFICGLFGIAPEFTLGYAAVSCVILIASGILFLVGLMVVVANE